MFSCLFLQPQKKRQKKKEKEKTEMAIKLS